MHNAEAAPEIPAPRDLEKHLAALSRDHEKGGAIARTERLAAVINAMTPEQIRDRFDGADLSGDTMEDLLTTLLDAQRSLSVRAGLVTEALARIERAASDDAGKGGDHF